MIGQVSRPYIMPVEKSVNIDSPLDMLTAQQLMEEKNYDAVEILLEEGADPNMQEAYGNFALIVSEDIKTSKLLLKYGAKINMRNNEIDLAKIQNLAAHRDIICFLLHDKKYQGSKTV